MKTRVASENELRNPAPRTDAGSEAEKVCLAEDLGRIDYGRAWALQRDIVGRRKSGECPDHLLLVEHPHVITLGRNADLKNLLISDEQRKKLHIDLWETNRGGDITYHGPGQIVGYPIVDLREWKRDVLAYLRSIEQVIMDTLTEFGVKAERSRDATGVWVTGAKIAAIGVHVSRWVTSHGFALNVAPDLQYFGHIVPCGLRKPVTSMEALLGQAAPSQSAVKALLIKNFGRIFGRRMQSETGIE